MKQTIKKMVSMLTLVCSTSMLAMASYADQESEKRYLIAIVNELNNLQALAVKAEAMRSEEDRLVFDYASLERDLVLMRAAIQQHIENPSRQPRRIGALAENYTEQVQDE